MPETGIGKESRDVVTRTVDYHGDTAKVLRSNLYAVQLLPNGFAVADRETCTMLMAQCHSDSSCHFFIPVLFKTHEDALDWILDGTIGKLQVGFGNPHVGFQSQVILPQGWRTMDPY